MTPGTPEPGTGLEPQPGVPSETIPGYEGAPIGGPVVGPVGGPILVGGCAGCPGICVPTGPSVNPLLSAYFTGLAYCYRW
jgi:hypothetical protein